MISDSIIDDEVWAEAPADAEEAFLYITLAAREKLSSIPKRRVEEGGYSRIDWRKQYIIEITTIATELQIQGLPTAIESVKSPQGMDNFDVALARVITRLRARKRELLRTDSVSLSAITKHEIRSQIERLREFVNKSNLPESAKERLHAKISAVEEELDKKRASLTTFWILAGAIGAFSQASVGTLSDLPDALDAVKSVVDYVNRAKFDETGNEQLLLEKPPLQITHQPEEPDGQISSD